MASPGQATERPSTLRTYIDRFRRGSPTSRAERDTTMREFWWLQLDKETESAITIAEKPLHMIAEGHHSSPRSSEMLGEEARITSKNWNPMEETSLLIVAPSPGSEIVPPERTTLQQLDDILSRKKMYQTSHKKSSSIGHIPAPKTRIAPSSDSPVGVISSRGLGSQPDDDDSLENRVSVSRDSPPVLPQFAKLLNPVAEGYGGMQRKLTSLHHREKRRLVSPKNPEDDILYQWRLKRKLQDARQDVGKRSDILKRMENQLSHLPRKSTITCSDPSRNRINGRNGDRVESNSPHINQCETLVSSKSQADAATSPTFPPYKCDTFPPLLTSPNQPNLLPFLPNPWFGAAYGPYFEPLRYESACNCCRLNRQHPRLTQDQGTCSTRKSMEVLNSEKQPSKLSASIRGSKVTTCSIPGDRPSKTCAVAQSKDDKDQKSFSWKRRDVIRPSTLSPVSKDAPKHRRCQKSFPTDDTASEPVEFRKESCRPPVPFDVEETQAQLIVDSSNYNDGDLTVVSSLSSSHDDLPSLDALSTCGDEMEAERPNRDLDNDRETIPKTLGPASGLASPAHPRDAQRALDQESRIPRRIEEFESDESEFEDDEILLVLRKRRKRLIATMWALAKAMKDLDLIT